MILGSERVPANPVAAPSVRALKPAQSRVLRRKCGCSGASGGDCPECRKKKLQRRALAHGPEMAPPIVHEVLRSPGKPLDSATRSWFESRFGHDFSKVRIHADARASESARSVGALAYTVGSDIAFLGGQYAPGTQRGARVLAHELSHVVQQGGMGGVPQRLAVGGMDDPAEIEAERAADAAVSGGFPAVRERAPEGRVRRLACDNILNAEEEPGATRGLGKEVERQVRVDLILAGGPATFPLSIPGASSSLLRTEECGGLQHITVPGTGFPDLTYINGRTVELAEVKIGTWDCLDLAERQVNNYVEVGNANAALKKSLGIDRFDLMPTSRFTPSQLQTASGTPVNVGWCEPGVIVYKAVKNSDQETFLCGAISDKGAVDRFLDRVTVPAEAAVDRYLDQTITPIIDRAIAQGLGGQNIEIPADVVRMLISRTKAQALEMVRKAMKAQLRQALQNILTVLCAAAAAKAAISMKDLLDKLNQEMTELVLVPALVVVAHELAEIIAQAIWVALKEAGLAILDALTALAKVLAAAAVAVGAWLASARLAAILGEIVEFVLEALLVLAL